jgi:hypothetical protein
MHGTKFDPLTEKLAIERYFDRDLELKLIRSFSLRFAQFYEVTRVTSSTCYRNTIYSLHL